MLRKANLDKNTNDVSLLLYETREVFHSPKPDLLVAMSSSSDRDAITKIRWLGDNETLIFLGENPHEPSQLYSFNIGTRVLRRLTNQPTALTNYDITLDGSKILFMTDPPARTTAYTEQDSPKEIVIAGQSLIDILGNHSEWEGIPVFMQESGGPPRQIHVAPEYDVAGWLPISLSPDGQYAVFTVSNRDIPQEWAGYQDPILKEIVANFPKGKVSPLKQHLVLNTRDGSLAPLVSAPMVGFDKISWAKDGESVFLSSYLPLDVADPDERKAREQDKYPIEISLPGREYRKVSKEAFPPKTIQEPPLDVTLNQDVNTPPKMYVSDRQNQRKALLLDLNPQFDELKFGVVKTIEWKVDGIEVIGGLYLPPDYIPGRKYPLVIQTHGFSQNEFSMDGLSEWSSAYAARPLAARGIMVLQSQDFKNPKDHDRILNDRQLGATQQESARNFVVHAYEEAINYLDKEGLIDRDRVGISGFSRTVCFVGFTLTHSTLRFAAASLVDGISCGYFEEIALPYEAWDVNSLNGGAAPFGGGLELWMKNAPGFNLDKVQTPVRLLAFGDDSVLSAWEWYAGLTLQKKPVDFTFIPHAVHIGTNVSQRALMQQGIVDWFSFWLKGEEDPYPTKAAQYARWRELRKLQQANDARATFH